MLSQDTYCYQRNRGGRVFWGVSGNRIGAMEREGISQGTGRKIGLYGP